MERHVDGREIVEVSGRAAWRRWLAERHTQRDAVWLVFHKKASDGTSPSYEQAVEEALCFGWIDSTVNRLDERRSLQLFAPRKPRSTWSASNKERVARLEREGLLAPAGIAAIERAQENGSGVRSTPSSDWRSRRISRPPSMRTSRPARTGTASARRRARRFSGGSSAQSARKRAKRIEQTVRMAVQGLRAQLDRD